MSKRNFNKNTKKELFTIFSPQDNYSNDCDLDNAYSPPCSSVILNQSREIQVSDNDCIILANEDLEFQSIFSEELLSKIM